MGGPFLAEILMSEAVGVDPQHILGLQCHSSGCNFWFGMVIMDQWDPWTFPTSRFGDGGHERYSMGSKRSFERVFF